MKSTGATLATVNTVRVRHLARVALEPQSPVALIRRVERGQGGLVAAREVPDVLCPVRRARRILKPVARRRCARVVRRVRDDPPAALASARSIPDVLAHALAPDGAIHVAETSFFASLNPSTFTYAVPPAAKLVFAVVRAASAYTVAFAK